MIIMCIINRHLFSKKKYIWKMEKSNYKLDYSRIRMGQIYKFKFERYYREKIFIPIGK